MDAASARAHGTLMAQAGRGERPRVSTGASRGVLTLSVVILGTYAAVVALLVVATFAPKGVVGWVGVVLGWLVVIAISPRPSRLEGVRLLPVGSGGVGARRSSSACPSGPC
ncbi:hypothetical protein [Terrabacter sp. 2RAF25]|uniref:hypothetical protein n=1 Tax=Terrabacter sp. 2RAF25 TaxID=3232998 RepID=UPI003F959389